MTGFEATARTKERARPRPSDERKRHPREMEDWLNFHIYHPLANRLAGLLVPTPITPNMVSFAGWMLIVAAAFLYTVISAGVVAFQLALAAGAPWGAYAMGGAFPGQFPSALRIAALGRGARPEQRRRRETR